MADVLGETPLRLEREVRQELVAELTSQGMSTRAIAPIIGSSDKTVRNDIAAGAEKYAPDRFDRDVAEAGAATSPPISADQFTGEIIDAEIVEPEPARVIEGLDGKTYKVPATMSKTDVKPTFNPRQKGWGEGSDAT